MKKPRLTICGVMSGSSLDGLDLAICTIERAHLGQFDWSIERTATIPFDKKLVDNLLKCYHASANQIYAIEQEFTEFSAQAIKEFIGKEAVDAIGWHGHTIFHEPNKGYTVQLGNAHTIANVTQVPVIAQMRAKDISLGGQGAPLAPTVEKYLLSEYSAFLNLGGIANISIHQKDSLSAFDITACNQPLNYLCQKHFNLPYDDGGKLAAKGKLDEALFNQLNQLPYLSEEPPKSLSNTWVIEDFMQIIDNHDAPFKNKLNTVAQHIAYQIKQACENMEEGTAIFATGGGVFNAFLMKLIEKQLSEIGVVLVGADKQMAESKEALLMALMAFLKIHNLPNSFASVTGAIRDNVNGVIYHP